MQSARQTASDDGEAATREAWLLRIVAARWRCSDRQRLRDGVFRPSHIMAGASCRGVIVSRGCRVTCSVGVSQQ